MSKTKEILKKYGGSYLAGSASAVSLRNGINELYNQGVIDNPSLIKGLLPANDDLFEPLGLILGNTFLKGAGELSKRLAKKTDNPQFKKLFNKVGGIKDHSSASVFSVLIGWEGFEHLLKHAGLMDDLNALLNTNMAPFFWGSLKDISVAGITLAALNYNSIKNKFKKFRSMEVEGEITKKEGKTTLKVPYDSEKAYELTKLSSHSDHYEGKGRNMKLYLANRNTGKPIEVVLEEDSSKVGEPNGKLNLTSPTDLILGSEVLKESKSYEGNKWVEVSYEESEEIEELGEEVSWRERKLVPYNKLRGLKGELKKDGEILGLYK